MSDNTARLADSRTDSESAFLPTVTIRVAAHRAHQFDSPTASVPVADFSGGSRNVASEK
jgi:hypothetical protein